MKAVNVREARLFEQWLNTTIASVTWRDLINFFSKDMEVIAKAAEELHNSELYTTVGKDIEEKAKELVETKCKPEWDRIAEEMKPLGERRNELAKEKAEAKEEFPEEKEKELTEIDNKLAELSNEYQKVTDDANKELNEFKEERIAAEQGGCFFLEDDEYALV